MSLICLFLCNYSLLCKIQLLLSYVAFFIIMKLHFGYPPIIQRATFDKSFLFHGLGLVVKKFLSSKKMIKLHKKGKLTKPTKL